MGVGRSGAQVAKTISNGGELKQALISQASFRELL